MKANNNTKKTLMDRSWAMARATRASMKTCMTRAWDLVKLTEALKTPGPVRIVYFKKDGTLRRALATLDLGTATANMTGTGRTPSPKVFTYWDIEKSDWRCFNPQNLVEWYKC